MIPRLTKDVKREIIKAESGTVCLLQAPTGSGKTYFVFRELYPVMHLRDERLLVVVNRLSLRQQSLRPLFEQWHVSDELATDLLSCGYISFPGVTITTYQYLSRLLCPDNDRYEEDHEQEADPMKPHPIPLHPEKFNTVVFDEAHFFLADAAFNPSMNSFRYTRDTFGKAKRIYISATMEPVRDTILKIEGIEDLWTEPEGKWAFPDFRYAVEWDDHLKKIQPAYPRYPRKCMELVGASPDYSYLIPSVLYPLSEDPIADDILNRRGREELKKAIVFVDSKNEGASLKNTLENSGLTCAFVFNDQNGELKMADNDLREYNRLMEKDKFEVDILIATAVIDNGVNVNDEAVTHIYPCGFEPVSVMQQVGRVRRISESQKLIMVIRPYGQETINRYYQNCCHSQDVLEEYMNASTEKRVIMTEKEDVLDALNRYTFRNRNGERKPSFFALRYLHYIDRELRLCQAAIEEDPENGFVRRVLGWFGLTENVNVSDERVTFQKNAEAVLREFINSHIGKELDKEAYGSFRIELARLYVDAYPNQHDFNYRPDRPIELKKANVILGKFGASINPGKKTGTHICKKEEENER